MPGPCPTLTASAPASTSASAPSPVEMFPATISMSCAPRIRRTTSRTPCEWPCAVSTTSTSTSASTRAAARSSASGAHSDRRADPKPALVVLRRVRVLDPLRDVLDRDQALEPPVGVDHRELLDLVAMEDLLGLLERRSDGRGHEVPRGHQRRDRLGRVGLEAEVAVREDADEDVRVVDDRDARDPVALHQLERVGDEVVGRKVTGSTIIPDSERLTLSTSAT